MVLAVLYSHLTHASITIRFPIEDYDKTYNSLFSVGIRQSPLGA